MSDTVQLDSMDVMSKRYVYWDSAGGIFMLGPEATEVGDGLQLPPDAELCPAFPCPKASQVVALRDGDMLEVEEVQPLNPEDDLATWVSTLPDQLFPVLQKFLNTYRQINAEAATQIVWGSDVAVLFRALVNNDPMATFYLLRGAHFAWEDLSRPLLRQPAVFFSGRSGVKVTSEGAQQG